MFKCCDFIVVNAKEINILTKHSRLKNSNWREGDQLYYIQARPRSLTIGSTETKTRKLMMSSPAP